MTFLTYTPVAKNHTEKSRKLLNVCVAGGRIEGRKRGGERRKKGRLDMGY